MIQSYINNILDKRGNTLLHSASYLGHFLVTEFLLKNGANVNVYNHVNNSPLHFASQEGFIEVVKLLLQYGANINNKNDNTCLPIHLAALVDILYDSNSDHYNIIESDKARIFDVMQCDVEDRSYLIEDYNDFFNEDSLSNNQIRFNRIFF